MTRFKDFGAGKSLEDKEPISFKLHEEDFECVKHIQGSVLLDLIAKSTSEEAGASAKVITDFFENVLLDESYKRFYKLVHDKKKIVHVETLSEIVSWLIEQYSDRPNQQPEDSSPGQ